MRKSCFRSLAVGSSSAAKLMLWGISSPADLRRDKEAYESLNSAQRIGLRHVEDFKKRIPRAEVEEIGKVVREVVDALGEGKLRTELCGSYRRGKPSSGDVDVLITPYRDEDHASVVFDAIIAELTKRGFLTDHLAHDTNCNIKRKRSYMGVCKGEERSVMWVANLSHSLSSSLRPSQSQTSTVASTLSATLAAPTPSPSSTSPAVGTSTGPCGTSASSPSSISATRGSGTREGRARLACGARARR